MQVTAFTTALVAPLPRTPGRRLAVWIGASVLSAFIAASSARAENGVSADQILLGQSTALSGPLAELGSDATTAAVAYFDYINAQGGVHGRKIKLLTLDDAYNTEKAIANGMQLIEKERVFALFTMFGTPANTALLPAIARHQIPSIAPYTGSNAMRAPLSRYVFNVRASYADETEKIIEHLGIRGIKRAAVVYQNNAFGRDGLAGVEQALARRQLKVHAVASVENDASDAAQAALELSRFNPQAIVMITAGKPSSEFIKSYNRLSLGMQYFMLSVMGTQTSVAALGKEGIGVVVSQVAPFPFSASSGIVREYQQIMKKMGVTTLSFTSIEGFLNAKVMVEGLKRTGRDLTRERFVSAMETMNGVDFDGYMVDFGKNSRHGSRYVELTVISRQGRFMR